MATVDGQFSQATDIGAVKSPGKVNYDEKNQSFIISGAGSGMTSRSDGLHFSWKEIQGDFIVRANMSFVNPSAHAQSKIGWLVRQSLEVGSPHVFASLNGEGTCTLFFREELNGETDHYELKAHGSTVIQLERRGEVFIMSAAKQGRPFLVTQVSHIPLPQKVLVGLAVSSGDAEVATSASFSNVRVIKPAKPDFVPYQDYIGSNLEIMDMATKQRRIVYRDPESIQAPNWTRDGKTLIYNANGRLFNFDIATSNITPLNTGFANNNNNDHVLNWAGSEIAISHHNAEDENRSTIYTLPLGGSDAPKQITAKGVGHSYLHGYSPDDKNMIFTAFRKNQWDIYKIDIESGQETQLTDTKTLDDGSEYSPDGKYIYFNSNRTGTMQLWRMDADGGNPKQLTYDKYNNWFPHVSPDGKKIVFLSYMDDIDSGDHPFYRHVYLREMPLTGGELKIIAYLYGGQGTINVPSWSPDGKYIAFVSNTVL